MASRAAGAPDVPGGIVDTHTHFYDPARPQGVPWPGKENKLLYKTTLPKDYEAVTKGKNVSGTVVVEASEWLEDNQWVLDLAKENPIIVGVVGHLDPTAEKFRGTLAVLAKNPLYRGIRLGAWGFKPEALKPLDALVDHDLSLDVLVNHERLPAVIDLAKRLPKLRIIIDHLAHPPKSGETDKLKTWKESLKQAAGQSNIYLKFSGIVESTGKMLPEGAPKEVDAYRDILDAAWDAFGESRLVYGSNWPVCAQFAPYSQVQDIAMDYILEKSAPSAAKVFRENSQAVYRWVISVR